MNIYYHFNYISKEHEISNIILTIMFGHRY